ncbi:MAG: oligosaccharide flippase family protein [Methylotenera sp.]|nr:oligosaccharide flippase family protein [Methylotenera sp.]
MFDGTMLRMLAGLLFGVWVAQYLGSEQFGVFSYAIAFVSIFGSVAKLGLDGILVRELVNEPQKGDFYLGTAFWLKLMVAVDMSTQDQRIGVAKGAFNVPENIDASNDEVATLFHTGNIK